MVIIVPTVLAGGSDTRLWPLSRKNYPKHEAKENNLDDFVVWGSGTPKREFLYVDDMAEASLVLHNLDEAVCKKKHNRCY